MQMLSVYKSIQSCVMATSFVPSVLLLLLPASFLLLFSLSLVSRRLLPSPPRLPPHHPLTHHTSPTNQPSYYSRDYNRCLQSGPAALGIHPPIRGLRSLATIEAPMAHPSGRSSVFLSVLPFACPYIRPAIHLSVYPSFLQSVLLSVLPFVYPSFHSAISLSSTRSSIRLFFILPPIHLSFYPSCCSSVILFVLPTVCLSIHWAISMSFFPLFHPSVLLSVLHPSDLLSAFSSVCSSIRRSIDLSFYLSFNPVVLLFVLQPICPSIRPLIHLSFYSSFNPFVLIFVLPSVCHAVNSLIGPPICPLICSFVRRSIKPFLSSITKAISINMIT